MSTATVRTRFAPSPTGFLHVGGARTALFNWLYARHHGGIFVLRIEDTDLERSTEESVNAILEGLEWLGLTWDEGPGCGGDFGPYFQSERLEIYQEYVQRLLDEGKAYHCYCTPEELQARREQALAEGRDPKYDRRCANLTEEEKRALQAEGRQSVIRFLSNDVGTTEVNDLIRGQIIFENGMLDDFVIQKSDGMPTYNFAVVIDDHLMKITHVIRGDDHISNTPRQIQVYQALGFPVPEFAHLPMILGNDKTRLSKRHGATSVTEYRDQGFLPKAMVNYLALLGWSYSATDTLFTPEELIEKFTLDRVSRNPAVFDMKKLEWMNGVYLRELDPEELTDLVLPRLQQEGLLPESIDTPVRERVKKIAVSLQSRIRTLGEFVPSSRYFFEDDIEYDPAAVDKILVRDYVPGMFAMLVEKLMQVEPFTEANIEQVFLEVQENVGRKLGDVIQPVRVAVTGTRVSPGMYEVLAALGRPRTLERLKVGAEMAKAKLAGRD
ncbi:MAG: glutamate--tRNA ligase [Firmicutes bacterium]|jgi:glutamyl-tRNA synthetase|nr:glutamate--tRNA ligase [Bacillota bacterium]